MANDLAERLTSALHEGGDRVAIAWDGGELTFAGLSDHVSDLVVDIEKLVGASTPGVRVAVDASRSASTVAGYVACILQDWTYVPVRDGSPPQRANAILRSAGPAIRLTPTEIGTGYRLTDLSLIDSEGVVDDVVALLHTSGSTGTPKGVAITSGNLTAFVDWCLHQLPMREADRVAALSPSTSTCARTTSTRPCCRAPRWSCRTR